MADDSVFTNKTEGEFAFECGRKCIGKKVIGVRFCNREEIEPEREGATLVLEFEDGSRFGLGIEGHATVHIIVDSEGEDRAIESSGPVTIQ